MPAIKVKATAAGYYGGQYHRPGSIFVLVDMKESDGTVKIDQNGVALTADTFFADHKKRGGWMQKVVDNDKTSLRQAQAREDLRALGREEQTDTESVPNAGGTAMVERAKTGVNAEVEPGSSAGENEKSSKLKKQSSQEVI